MAAESILAISKEAANLEREDPQDSQPTEPVGYHRVSSNNDGLQHPADLSLTATSSLPSSHICITEEPILLRVGERKFWTMESTLIDGSAYFTAYFNGFWTNKQCEDGSYFIDADGESFEDMLRYLRLKTMPIFWNSATGFDFARYATLKATASFFGVLKLEEWIAKKKYVQAVTVTTTTKSVDGDLDQTHMGLLDSSESGDVTLEYNSSWRIDKRYICPRRISAHMGDDSRCGRQCLNAQGTEPKQFQKVSNLTTLVMKKKTTFNAEICDSAI